jgi:hypothetical protein
VTTVGVSVDGLPELVARLRHAASGVEDLTPANRELLELVANVGDRLTPHRTGKLVAGNVYTPGPHGWAATNAVAYARFQHWGTRELPATPWLLMASQRTEERQLDKLADHLQHLLDTE